MVRSPCPLRLLVAATAFAVTFAALPARAADIIAEWPNVQMPPPPQLKQVTLSGKTTALLVMDMMTTNCPQRPSCPDTVPKIKAMMDRARAAGVLVAYTLPGGGKIVDPSIAPHKGEVVNQKQGGADKFLGDDLNRRLKRRHITTVIVCGTSAQGVGIGTGSEAAQRGYKVIYPVDCVSSESPFRELYAAYHMSGGGPPVVTKSVTVTRSDMITFENAK